MLILANENIPAVLIEALRSAGHDVFWARTDARGAADEDLLARAEQEGRVLLTFIAISENWRFAPGCRQVAV